MTCECAECLALRLPVEIGPRSVDSAATSERVLEALAWSVGYIRRVGGWMSPDDMRSFMNAERVLSEI